MTWAKVVTCIHYRGTLRYVVYRIIQVKLGQCR